MPFKKVKVILCHLRDPFGQLYFCLQGASKYHIPNRGPIAISAVVAGLADCAGKAICALHAHYLKESIKP